MIVPLVLLVLGGGLALVASSQSASKGASKGTNAPAKIGAGLALHLPPVRTFADLDVAKVQEFAGAPASLDPWIHDQGGKRWNPRFATPHLFSPAGSPIVLRRYSEGLGGRIDLRETDAGGGIYGASTPPGQSFSILFYNPDGDWSGSTDWSKAAGELASIAATVVSFVPGVGSGIAAGIVAGVALARGASLSEAVLAGVRASLPGGPLAVAAFDVGRALASGADVSAAALATVRAQLPPSAQAGFDASIAVLKGQSITSALVDAGLRKLRDELPPGAARDALDVAIAVATGQKIQAAIMAKVAPAFVPAGPLTEELRYRLAQGETLASAAKAVGGLKAEAAVVALMPPPGAGAAAAGAAGGVVGGILDRVTGSVFRRTTTTGSRASRSNATTITAGKSCCKSCKHGGPCASDTEFDRGPPLAR